MALGRMAGNGLRRSYNGQGSNLCALEGVDGQAQLVRCADEESLLFCCCQLSCLVSIYVKLQ